MEKLGENLLETNVYSWLREVAESEDADLKLLNNMCTYVMDTAINNIKLKFDVSEDHYKWCWVATDVWIYSQFAATPEYWYLGAKRQLMLLNELVDVVFDGADPGE